MGKELTGARLKGAGVGGDAAGGMAGNRPMRITICCAHCGQTEPAAVVAKAASRALGPPSEGDGLHPAHHRCNGCELQGGMVLVELIEVPVVAE